MNEHTIKLLEDCNSGCKMAINSISQICDYIDDDELKNLVKNYKLKHENLEIKTSNLLLKNGKPEKEPNPIISGLSWFTTEMKLMIRDDSHQVSKLLMDGCNMGIQSISESVNKYTDADFKSLDLASDLIKLDESFMQDLKKHL